MSIHKESDSKRLWQRLVSAEDEYYGAWAGISLAERDGVDFTEHLRPALGDVRERGTALRFLAVADERVKRRVFPELVEAASVGHADFGLARDVLFSLDREWLLAHLPAEIERILALPTSDDEEYRRFAQILHDLQSPYLAALVARATTSENPHIREVADDYRT